MAREGQTEKAGESRVEGMGGGRAVNMRNQGDREEAELERLTQEKEKLEEEKRVEQQCVAALCGLERAAEQR